jgi:hypothetical protein
VSTFATIATAFMFTVAGMISVIAAGLTFWEWATPKGSLRPARYWLKWAGAFTALAVFCAVVLYVILQ